MSAESMRQALRDRLRARKVDLSELAASRTDYDEMTLRVLQGRYLECVDMTELIDETYKGLGL